MSVTGESEDVVCDMHLKDAVWLWGCNIFLITDIIQKLRSASYTGQPTCWALESHNLLDEIDPYTLHTAYSWHMIIFKGIISHGILFTGSDYTLDLDHVDWNRSTLNRL
ncbi:unnamed protein product [Allacma fusca]|uniref:Uncharacterized protein n=1 Tax=Allacma fusca TaxID=39272 RepID=A0A8J2KE76_9HEXA|nr:unnamed protein product [Allacma fusca]